MNGNPKAGSVMLSKMRIVLIAAVVTALATATSLAWAEHGHGGHGGGGGWSGSHGHASFGHFDYGGYHNHFGGTHFYSGRGYYGWPSFYSYRPYSYFYRPYAYYSPYTFGYLGYPYSYNYYGYPSGYYGYPAYYNSDPSDYCSTCDDDGSVALLPFDDLKASAPREYSVSRPVPNTAGVEIRLPDPDATIWVEGKEIASSGTVRQFHSPPLEASRQFTYTIKAEWHDNGKLVSDQRKVNVESNRQTVVDFTQPLPSATNTDTTELPTLPPPQRPPAP